ncbi:MAG TPA: hypothetical protein DFI01_05170 [Bacteroidales bacterium]|nr:hypothetical protein [Bacteroidales bacterium]
MYTSPNKEYIQKKNKLYDPYQLGSNQIAKRFKIALDVLLSEKYYEGTEYGQYYNSRRVDGRSKIYVDQPEIERKLKEEFVDGDSDITKFLVGYTGVGKTTLLRNVFQIFDRDICEKDNNLVIYFSFYSMTPALEASPKVVVQEAVRGVFDMAITHLCGVDFIERIKKCNDDYYKDFYDFIYHNNKSMIHSYLINPMNREDLISENPCRKILAYIQHKDPFDYTLSEFKFQLYLYELKYHKQFNNIILLFDDLEAKTMDYQNELIELAWHIKKCLQAFRNRKYSFKILITLRNYSFRLQQIRLKEAFREINKNDIILKNNVPNLSEVLSARMNCVKESKGILEQIKEIDSYRVASASLDMILKQLYGQYDKMLLSLTHNNIFVSMKLLMRIVTNKKHLGKYEIFNDGAFLISPERYNIRNSINDSSRLGNADVFYSLVYGEDDVYQDTKDYYLTNIMHFRKEENVDTELMGILIIQFLIRDGICMGDINYDGLKTKEGSEIVQEILNVFDNCTKEQHKNLKQGLNAMMKHLYEGGVLLQSIIEPKKEDSNKFSREYAEDIQVYLSMRGFQLYKMLETNSLLFEAYRDDIDTEIDKNDVATLKLSKFHRIKYCFDYTRTLICKEEKYLRCVSDKKQYINTFGPATALIVLMKGLKESILKYYSLDSSEKAQLTSEFNEQTKRINDYLTGINIDEGANFETIEAIIT